MAKTTKTTTGRGRPAIGPKLETRVSAELAAELEAWAAERHMTRPEAMRHLIATGLKITDAYATLGALGRQSAEQIFTDAGDDPEQIYQLLLNEAGCSEHRAEIIDQIASVEVSVMAARGYWFLLVNRGLDLNERGHATRWDHEFQVHQSAEAAREAFADAIVRLTKQYWTKDMTEPMWCDFEEDIPLFITLAEAGRIPAAAIDLAEIRAYAAQS